MAALTDPNTGLSLALAVVASSTPPLVLLDEGLNVVVASRSFLRAFDVDPGDVVGQPFLKLHLAEWDVPQLRALLKAMVEDKDYFNAQPPETTAAPTKLAAQ